MRARLSQGRLYGVALAVGVPVAYTVLVRPRLLNWGATDDEIVAEYPGDEIIPTPNDASTMASTLQTPPEIVWRWLQQMGGDRAGWYSWDWFDNNGKPSADLILPEWQDLEVGQRMSRTSAPGQEPGWFVVEILEPSRTLVLRSSYEMFTGREFDPRSGRPSIAWVDGIWGFHLKPAPGGGTRLVARSRNRSRPSLISRPLQFLLAEPMHFVMQTRQFRNLQRRTTPSQ